MSYPFKKVLFPTDFSDLSLSALPFARSMADGADAELHCIHVVDDAFQYWSALGPESIPIGPPPEELLGMGRKRMEKFVAQHLSGLKKSVVPHVAVGRPFSEIIAYARDRKIDLIVMGTHGRGAIAHMLLGSTTEKVVRKAPCAVLTVRPQGQDFEMP